MASFNDKKYFDNNANNKFKNYNINNNNDSNNRLNNSVILGYENCKKINFDTQSINKGYNSNLNKTTISTAFGSNSSFSSQKQNSIILCKGFQEKFDQIGKNTIINPVPITSFGSNSIGINSNYTKLSSLQILLVLYEGMCNFLIFAKACTPYVNKSVSHLLDDTKLRDYFKSFEKISAYGLDINLINEQSK